MDEFLTTINYLKEVLAEDGDFNAICTGVSNDIDLDKKTLYPLAYIQLIGYNPNPKQGMVSFIFEVHILKQRIVQEVPFDMDAWLRSENELQNYNDTINIATKKIAKLGAINRDDIELMNEVQTEIVTLEYTNLLDGVKLTIELGITNGVGVC